MRLPFMADLAGCVSCALLAVSLAAIPAAAQDAAPAPSTPIEVRAEPSTPASVSPQSPAADGQGLSATDAPLSGSSSAAPADEAAPAAPATADPSGHSAETHGAAALGADMSAAPSEFAPVTGDDASAAARADSEATDSLSQATPLAEGTPAAAPATQNGKALPRNLSPWGMFQAADIIVKGVMIGLAFASFVTWTVWLAKVFELAIARRRLRRAFRRMQSARTLADAYDEVGRMRGTGPYLVCEAADEVRASEALLDYGDGAGIKERVTSRLSRVEADAGRRLTRGTGVIATIGATAPFVGLFGTVWGIMNSFIGISESQTTNLAVVAPGIAEALLATAIGLVAAIPAVIIYNSFARSITGYRLELANASAAIERLVSRDLDFRRLSQQTTGVAHAAE